MTPESAAKSNAAAKAAGWFATHWDHANIARSHKMQIDAMAAIMPHVQGKWTRRSDVIRAAMANGHSETCAKNGIDRATRTGAVETKKQRDRTIMLRTKSGAVLDTAKGQLK